MPKPPAEFELHKLYGGKVQVKFFPNSHTYKVYDPENKRNWEKSPSATGLTDRMEKGAGLMMYAMSEAMKNMDQVFHNKSLRAMVDDPEFTLTQMFKDARQAHKDKTALGQRVGRTSHDYVEKFLKSLKKAQDTGTAFNVPPIPLATDIKSELEQSYANITAVMPMNDMTQIDKYRETLARDIKVRSDKWNEEMMVQRACQSAKEFFVAAVKAGALKVWAVEQFVHSRKYFFSGRFDSILEFVKNFTWRGYTIHAGVYIADFKTSNAAVEYPMGIFPNHLAQLGAYDVAYCEEFPQFKDRIKGHLVLGSSKYGEGFHPYVSLKRERNRQWAIALVPVMEFMYQGEKELKGLQLYKKG